MDSFEANISKNRQSKRSKVSLPTYLTIKRAKNFAQLVCFYKKANNLEICQKITCFV